MNLWDLLRNPLFHIDERETTFRRRGFPSGSPVAQSHLEGIGRSFLRGYHGAVDSGMSKSMTDSLAQVGSEYQGFAYEGAAMGLGLLDVLSFGKKFRWKEFVDGPGQPHKYVVHVGLGWVVARLPWLRSRPEKFISNFDPLLKWLVLDGYGFHEGYFHWKKWGPDTGRRPKFEGYASRAFDQGLGRCLWFVSCADAVRAADLIERFEPDRQADLWSGVGLACAYAGKPTAEEVESLMRSAGSHVIHFRQGITFGAEARELAGIPAEHTERTCQIACGMSASEAARLTYTAIPPTVTDSSIVPAYETWRSQIRDLLTEGIPSCL